MGRRREQGLGLPAKLMAETMRYGINMETSDDADTTRVCIDIPEEPHNKAKRRVNPLQKVH